MKKDWGKVTTNKATEKGYATNEGVGTASKKTQDVRMPCYLPPYEKYFSIF